MIYKGTYADETTYSVGDVVVFTDNIPYCLQKPAPAGTKCHNTLYWSRVIEEVADMVSLFHSFFMGLQESAQAAAGTTQLVNEMLFDNKTLILASSTESSQKRYAVTVDDEDGLNAEEIISDEDGES